MSGETQLYSCNYLYFWQVLTLPQLWESYIRFNLELRRVEPFLVQFSYETAALYPTWCLPLRASFLFLPDFPLLFFWLLFVFYGVYECWFPHVRREVAAYLICLSWLWPWPQASSGVPWPPAQWSWRREGEGQRMQEWKAQPLCHSWGVGRQPMTVNPVFHLHFWLWVKIKILILVGLHSLTFLRFFFLFACLSTVVSRLSVSTYVSTWYGKAVNALLRNFLWIFHFFVYLWVFMFWHAYKFNTIFFVIILKFKRHSSWNILTG